MSLRDAAGPLRLLAVAIPSLAGATAVVAVLQDGLGVQNASAVYLVAVVVTALASGTAGAVVASIASFLLYNYLYTEPRFTFTVDDPGVWLSVVLLLFVGIVVGQLAALQRSRTEIARAREREALALFRLSRALATRESTLAVLPEVTEALASETRMTRVWIALGPDDAAERIASDSGGREPPTVPGLVGVLRRTPGDEPARWVRVHQPSPRSRASAGVDAYRVRIEAGGATLGSIWALRDRRAGPPDRTETRLLAAAADQIGQALAHDRLAAESRAAEVARQSDALKSALLQSVSHDLRTPLATIRAAAGTLRPGSPFGSDDRQQSVDAIDREVEYLDRLVTNLLDLSRIEAGALRAEPDVFELDDLVDRSLERLRPRLADRPIEIDVRDVPVRVDPVFFDEALTNVIDNAVKYTPPGTAIRIASGAGPGGVVRLTIEDAGEGVPADALPRLFEKFYRVPGRRRTSRSGTGIGLAVTRGLLEAMGGHVRARRSALGGLAVDLDLPAATVPATLTAAGP
ncbi:MAG TPA: ATP-binding protein [Candidatus Limnocylindrales bacterium]|nr:ATP-binding protein [Candidatus Limnocylindrales bacterium]